MKTHHHEAPANIDPSKVKLPSPCTVLITGGGRGLSEATAYAFAKAGASDIILAARTATELDTVATNLGKMSSNINASTVRCDVASEPDVLALTDLLKTKYSFRLNVLVNDAGFLDAGWQPITADSAPASDWTVFDVNLRRLSRHSAFASVSPRDPERAEDPAWHYFDVVAFCKSEYRDGNEQVGPEPLYGVPSREL